MPWGGVSQTSGSAFGTDSGAGRRGREIAYLPEHGPQGRHMLEQVLSAGHLHLCGRVRVIIEHDEASVWRIAETLEGTGDQCQVRPGVLLCHDKLEQGPRV